VASRHLAFRLAGNLRPPALPEPEHHVTGLPCAFCFNVTEFDPSGSHLIALYQRGVGIVWDVDPKLWERRARSPAAP
jgi:hypothetical protein